MKSCVIENEFHKGQCERASYPLQSGRYRLEEARAKHRSWMEEIARIAAIRDKKESRYALRHCVFQEAGWWIRKIPRLLAYDLSYEVAAGYWALESDGAPLSILKEEWGYYERWIKAALDQLKEVYSEVKRDLRGEYARMKKGFSLVYGVAGSVEEIESVILTRMAKKGG